MHSRWHVKTHMLWLAQYHQGTMPWQLCLASVKHAGTIQVALEMGKTIPENSLKFKTKVILLKYAPKLTIGFGSMLLCCKLQLQVADHY